MALIYDLNNKFSKLKVINKKKALRFTGKLHTGCNKQI